MDDGVVPSPFDFIGGIRCLEYSTKLWLYSCIACRGIIDSVQEFEMESESHQELGSVPPALTTVISESSH